MEVKRVRGLFDKVQENDTTTPEQLQEIIAGWSDKACECGLWLNMSTSYVIR